MDPARLHPAHPASWWAEFLRMTDRFDGAVITESIADEIIPKIQAPLLRREAEIATEVVVRHLNKSSSLELAERAEKAVERLLATVDRLDERATGGDLTTTEAMALCHVLEGRYAEAAAEAEPFIGTAPLLRAFVTGLRLERFDVDLTLRLIKAGQAPQLAVRSGLTLGKYGWWPDWLLRVVTDWAVEGTLDQAMIAALDKCAYAELTPYQARIARMLLNGDESMIEMSAHRLEDMGEFTAATKLREGDLASVALAARLIPID